MPSTQSTVDPSQINSASEIPPSHAQYVGLSPQRQVDVYCGTLPGDVDAQPAAKELLGTSSDTGTVSNVDYIYNMVSKLYGGPQLPDLQSPSRNAVKSVVFVSGSAAGGYGAFHIGGGGPNQADFDRIVSDSLNASGNYSSGSGLANAMAPVRLKVPRLFAASQGPDDLLGILHPEDPRLEKASLENMRMAHGIALQSILALRTAFEARNASARIPGVVSPSINENWSRDELIWHLIHANQQIFGLTRAVAAVTSGRHYLSTALFAAEIVESFQTLTQKADPGKTDGEAVSRVLGFKLAPEISLVPGFNGGVTQQWWQDGHPDFANDNSQDDQSSDGNASGVMFLLFLTDYLGIALDEILQHMPATNGAPLGQTYASLRTAHPELDAMAGRDGAAAFQKMISLLQQNAQTAAGTLNLPADGNPFPSMPGARQGGLFATTGGAPGAPGTPVVGSGSLVQEAQVALGLEAQIEQQLAGLKSALQRVQADISTPSTPAAAAEVFAYGPPLPASVVAALEQRAVAYRAPEFDQTLQAKFWPHVYNELPGTGTQTGRLQVISGTLQKPLAVQITGTISGTKLEPDGDLHISFQPDDPAFPTNHSATEAPLEIEVVYAGPVTQADAQAAHSGYTNPFDITQLTPGTRIQAAGPLIFDRAHGRVTASGQVQYGMEIHPLAGMTVLASPTPLPGQPIPVPAPAGQLSSDLASASGQAATLSQTLASLSALVKQMQNSSPPPSGVRPAFAEAEDSTRVRTSAVT
jgi:hypothetical protein